MTPNDGELLEWAGRLGGLLQVRGLRLTTAESCTGGWVAKVLTDVAGCSHWFERGFVTYTNESKVEMLGVDPVTLERHGAVSRETVAAMAVGALGHSRAQLALAISGIAGPGGGSAEKPVGTVCLAWAGLGPVLSVSEHFDGDREAVRRQSVRRALAGMVARLEAG